MIATRQAVFGCKGSHNDILIVQSFFGERSQFSQHGSRKDFKAGSDTLKNECRLTVEVLFELSAGISH